MIPSPDNKSLVKIAKKVFRYDEVLNDGWGWPHDMYYDKNSETFIIANFPASGYMYEMSAEPDFGLIEIAVGGKTYRARVYE